MTTPDQRLAYAAILIEEATKIITEVRDDEADALEAVPENMRWSGAGREMSLKVKDLTMVKNWLRTAHDLVK